MPGMGRPFGGSGAVAGIFAERFAAAEAMFLAAEAAADAAGLDYVEIEVRQDLVADGAGQDTICEVIARALAAAGLP